MAIRLKVLEDPIYRFKTDEGIPIYPEDYHGAYEVTPTEATQTLPTEGLMMNNDVTVKPIPNNYGRISWNGSVLTVS